MTDTLPMAPQGAAPAAPVADPTAPSMLAQLQMDYAWKWFCFHAEQRTKMFNFMLVALGILATAVVSMLDKGRPVLAAALSLFASALTVAFFALDRRNKRLYDVALNVLIHLEQNVVFGGRSIASYSNPTNQVSTQISGRIQLEDQGDGTWQHVTKGKHRFWMPTVMLMFGLLFLAIAVYSESERRQASPDTIIHLPAAAPAAAPRASTPVPSTSAPALASPASG